MAVDINIIYTVIVKIEDIRNEGLLEYYVLGLLSEEDNKRVESYLQQYPELSADLRSIQLAMQQYSISQGIAPKANLQSKVINLIKEKGDKTPIESTAKKETAPATKTGGSSNWPSYLLGAILLGSQLYYVWNLNNKVEAAEERAAVIQQECDSISNAQVEQLALYESLLNPQSRAIPLTPTEKYQETDLLFFINDQTKTNYIKINNLPAIASGKAFQLWSLKDGVDPIPLTVFSGVGSFVLPVDYEDGTGTYAITIEDAGGATTPDLTKLIGTAGV